MRKLNTLHLLLIAAIMLVLSGCATDHSTTSSTSTSPLNRNNNNGLASYMH
jgi:uncharacterized lipoprotein YajG